MSNEELVLMIQQGEDVTSNLERLYCQNKQFIYKMANKYKGIAEVADLEQEGYLGLYGAVYKYDSDQDIKFLSYAGHWIHQAMVRYIENNNIVRIPSHLYQKILKYRNFVRKFETEYNRQPTDQETSYYMELGIQQIERIKANLHLRSVTSIDHVISNEDGELTLGDTISSNENLEQDVVEYVVIEQLKDYLWGEVDKLSNESAEVIKSRYQDRLTLAEVGQKIGKTRERVRQLEAKGLRSMRKTSIINNLKEFDIIHTHAYGGGVAGFNRTWTSSTEYAAIKLLEI